MNLVWGTVFTSEVPLKVQVHQSALPSFASALCKFVLCKSQNSASDKTKHTAVVCEKKNLNIHALSLGLQIEQ